MKSATLVAMVLATAIQAMLFVFLPPAHTSTSSRRGRQRPPTTSAPVRRKIICTGNTVLGGWYMGTMGGEDHNLTLKPNGTLSLQNGGCFHQDPAIKSSWRRQGDRITFDNAVLRRQLGSSLRIVHYRGYMLLVPQRDAESGRALGYSLRYCFWQNPNMAAGLKVPSPPDPGDWLGTLSAGARHDHHH